MCRYKRQPAPTEESWDDCFKTQQMELFQWLSYRDSEMESMIQCHA